MSDGIFDAADGPLWRPGGPPYGVRPLVVPDDPPGTADGLDVAAWERAAAADPAAVNALLLPVTSGDYAGSLIDKANRRHLLQTYGEDCFIRLEWAHHARGLALLLSAEPAVVREVLDAGLRAEAYYPILDDGAYQELLDELVDEALGDWALADARRDLAGEGYDTDGLDADKMAAALHAALDAGAPYPCDEGYGDGNVVLPMAAILQQLRGTLPAAGGDPLSGSPLPAR